MAEIISLNKARKVRARAAAEKLAAENPVRFGRSKAEKQQARQLLEVAAKKLDGLKLEPPLGAPPQPDRD